MSPCIRRLLRRTGEQVMRITNSLSGTAMNTFEGCDRLAGPAEVGVLMQGALCPDARTPQPACAQAGDNRSQGRPTWGEAKNPGRVDARMPPEAGHGDGARPILRSRHPAGSGFQRRLSIGSHPPFIAIACSDATETKMEDHHEKQHSHQQSCSRLRRWRRCACAGCPSVAPRGQFRNPRAYRPG